MAGGDGPEVHLHLYGADYYLNMQNYTEKSSIASLSVFFMSPCLDSNKQLAAHVTRALSFETVSTATVVVCRCALSRFLVVAKVYRLLYDVKHYIHSPESPTIFFLKSFSFLCNISTHIYLEIMHNKIIHIIIFLSFCL